MKNIFLLCSLFLMAQCNAQTNDFAFRTVADSLYLPWDLQEGPNNDIWFTQKNGTVSRLQPSNGNIKQLVFIGEVQVQGEGGLLGMALHPHFNDTPWVYLVYNYQNAASQLREKVVAYRFDQDSLYFQQLIVGDIKAASIHNGSRLLAHQQYLFISTGDAADPSLSQNINSLNGKILRYHLDGTIPADNPISGSAIWSWGHRNPQGLIAQGNKIISSEHGPNTDDEINIIEKGRNYGWPNVAGYCNTTAELQYCLDSNVKEPVYAWTPTIAVCGIAFNTHNLFPQWQNKLLMTTLKDSKLYVLSLSNSLDSVTQITTIPGFNFGRLRDVLVAKNGNIYVATSNGVDKIIEVYDPTPTRIKEATKKMGWKIYPQPAHQFLQVEKTLSSLAKWFIADVSGRVLERGEIIGSTNIGVANLQPGLYWLHLMEENQPTQQFKFLKQ